VPQGSQHEVMTPGKNEKHYLAGALDALIGELYYTLGDRNNNGWFRELLNGLDHTYPASRIERIDVVV
jgi:putative transposase